MTTKPCTITIVNKGRKLVFSGFRGVHFVTMLETTITDNETLEVLNTNVSHSADRDTITFNVFYNYDPPKVWKKY